MVSIAPRPACRSMMAASTVDAARLTVSKLNTPAAPESLCTHGSRPSGTTVEVGLLRNSFRYCSSVAASERIRSAKAFRTASIRSAYSLLRTILASVIGSNGLAITAAAPSAVRRLSSCGAVKPVKNIIAAFAVLEHSRSRARTAGPSIPGILTSQRIRSGAHSAAIASASCPVAQVVTVSAGSRASDNSTIFRMSASSSM